MSKFIEGRIDIHLKKVNLLQGGSQKYCSACDINFYLNAVIDHVKYGNKSIFASLQLFNMWHKDSTITLWDVGVRNELLALVYKLNE